MTDFKKLEAKVLDHAQRQGLALNNQMTKDLIGHQIMDLILTCTSLGLDFTECLETAYINLQVEQRRHEPA
jgi:galactose-1-phosphate uridylyltransferase